MSYEDLNEFIELLDKEGEILRIHEPVSPQFEITEITDRVTKAGGPALLFENAQSPSGHPVAINLFGSIRRIKLAFKLNSFEELASDIMQFLEAGEAESFLQKLKLIPKVKRLANVFPKKVKKAPCQEIILKEEELDLTSLPILTCWPRDAGPFITLPLVVTRHPITGKRNLGMYRMQVFDRNTTGMHWHAHKGGAEHYRIAENLGQRLPVSVAIGADPACVYAATAPLPEDMDELFLAGYLRKKPVDIVKCITNELYVPANAQYVLEGYVEPGERKIEGPFGDHTGFYSPAGEFPVFHVTCLTMRKNPIYHATIVGRPPMEDAFLGKVTERLFLPIIKKQLPEIIDMNLLIEGGFHNIVFVSIDKRYPGHAKKIMHALWGMGQMMFSKMIFVFDREVDVQNVSEALWYLANQVAPMRDIIFTHGPMDELDHSAEEHLYGSKMGVDCTRKWPEEGFKRHWPEEVKMTDEVKQKIDRIWHKLGIA